jgi:hypothetical protein
LTETAGDNGRGQLVRRPSAAIVINAIEGLTHRLALRPSAGVTPEVVADEITDLVRAYVQTSRAGRLQQASRRI